MFRHPVDTGHRPSTAPTVCSALVDMIWSKSNDPKESVSKTRKNSKRKHENLSSNQIQEKRKKESEHDLKVVFKKIRKATRSLPVILESNDAYVKGLITCDTCMISKEDYKKYLQDIKVIGLLVDGVIEKEQTELIENFDEERKEERKESFLKSEERDTSNCNETRLSVQVEVHSPKSNIDHSLQCVLIKLQKAIGDVMVQVCFVKSKHLGNSDRYNKFDLSLSDLSLFKYQYSNLTDKIIQLFKKPPEGKKSKICVMCLKEKLFTQIDVMSELVKSGKNLKLVMRNQNGDLLQGQCCSRSYPHIHAEDQGRPIVLKYSLPFKGGKSSGIRGQEKPKLPGSDEDLDKLLDLDFNNEYDQFDSIFKEEGNMEEGGFSNDNRRKMHGSTKKSTHSSKVNENERANTNIESNDNLEEDSFPGKEIRQQMNGSIKKSTHSSKIHENERARTTPGHNDNLPSAEQIANVGSMKKLEESTTSVIGNLSVTTPTEKSKFRYFLKTSSDFEVNTPSGNTDLPDGNQKNDKLEPEMEEGTKQPAHQKKSVSFNETEKQESFCDSDGSNETVFKQETMGSITSQSKKSGGNASVSSLTRQTLQSNYSVNTNKTVTNSNDDISRSTYFTANMSDKFDVPSVENQSFMSKNSEKTQFKDDRIGKNPFGTEVIQQTTYVGSGSSDLPRKRRVTFSDDLQKDILQNKVDYSVPNTSNTVRNDSISKPPPIEELSVKKSQNCIKEIKHQDKKVEEILRNLGPESLLMISSPAKCSRLNNLLSEDQSLPLSPSLYSLPLDMSDMDYIVDQARKCEVNPEDIPVVVYEWKSEDKEADEDAESKDTKSNRVFAGNETPCEQNESERDSFSTSWKRMNPGTGQEYNMLPTIKEEDVEFESETSISQRNLVKSLDKSNSMKNKPQSSRFNTNPTELRYCSIEHENKNIVNKATSKLLTNAKLDNNKECNKSIRNKNTIPLESKKDTNESLNNAVINSKSEISCSHIRDCDNETSCVVEGKQPPITCSSLSLALEELMTLSTIYKAKTDLPNNKRKNPSNRNVNSRNTKNVKLNSPTLSTLNRKPSDAFCGFYKENLGAGAKLRPN